MTVSLALRNHPRISEETRRKVLEVAERLGYRPNPMVSDLMAHIRSSRPIPYQANLAYLTAFETENGWKYHQAANLACQGMQTRAGDVGYLIDTFWMKDPCLDQERLGRVLRSRNIQGVIIAPLPRPGMLDQLNWPEWSAVSLGNSLTSPRIHRVTHHQFHGIWLVLRKLEEKGYRRIGLVMDQNTDEKVDRTFTSCMAGYQLRIPTRNRVPTLLQPQLDPKQLGVWLKKYKPDVVIGNDALVFCLHELGISIPGEVALAHLSIPSSIEPSASGLDQHWRLAGAAAVDTLVAQIYRNERGIPGSPQTVMLEGAWVEGQTTPDKNAD